MSWSVVEFNNMIESIGTIRYRPNWWIWLEVDPNLGKYLRHLCFLASYKCKKLGRPSQGEHITVVSSHEKISEAEKYHYLWGKYEGLQVEFSIILEPDTNGNAWWFPIRSISLELIREELGLSRKRAIDLHYCPGYENPGKVKELQLK